MEASSVMKSPLFAVGLLVGLLFLLRRRGSVLFPLVAFLHFAAAVASTARTAARAAAALVTTTTAAFATASRRTAAAATTRTVREHVAEAATERATVAAAARLTAAIAALSTRTAATAAAVASEPESIGGARDGQHGHHQGNTMKIHLPISICIRVCKR